REAESGQKLDHPGVMKVLAYNTRGQVYIVMEWVEGRLLRYILHETKKMPLERATKMTAAICDTLAYCHRNGVVHRDLKPENIMVNDQDEVKLIDFGIAGLAGSRRLTFSKLSQVMGSPDYIAPERVKGSRGDGRAGGGRRDVSIGDGEAGSPKELSRLSLVNLHHALPTTSSPDSAQHTRAAAGRRGYDDSQSRGGLTPTGRSAEEAAWLADRHSRLLVAASAARSPTAEARGCLPGPSIASQGLRFGPSSSST
ncbi:MAG: serine/threonine-protein kinase, partial [bacterium]